jgi:parvulin-like peptidyl-prolyl isomerase
MNIKNVREHILVILAGITGGFALYAADANLNTDLQQEAKSSGLEQAVKSAQPATPFPKKSENGTLVEARYPVDEIVVVIYAQEGSEIITQSDLQRPTLDGSPRTLEDTIFERLLFLDAKKYKMIADEDAIDKHLATVQRQNNMTLDDLKAVFRSSGYTYEEGREQFGIMYAVNAVIDFKIRSRLIVPEKDVLAYYNAHPVMLEPTYQVQRAVIPYSKVASKQALVKELANFQGLGITWEEPFWVVQNDLAESKRFVIDMKMGTIAEPQEIDAGYELIKLVDKKGERVAPLEERYREIVDILRKPKYDELMVEYKKILFDSASVVYLKKELQPATASTSVKSGKQVKKAKKVLAKKTAA